MHWAEDTKQHVAMFLIDFENTYDRVEWGFLIMMLEAFGFPKDFYHMVSILFRDASTQVEINGSWSQAISFSRYSRQGYPLASTLLGIASDAIFFLLRESSLSPRVKDITFPNNTNLVSV